MYGWLDTSFCAVRAWLAEPGECCLRIAPLTFVHWLPLLGSVLYVPARGKASAAPQPSHGLLSESPLLTPVLLTRYLRMRGTVSADGPREWIDCLDTRGDILAQLHLLPDTDYLAWDNLPGDTAAVDELPSRAGSYLFRGAAAHLIRFRCQSLATITCLGEGIPPRISPLGRLIAQSIAGAQPLLMHGTPIV